MYKVMIADDEDIIRRGLRSFVEKNKDFEVTAMAEDGQDALNMALEGKPDACFVDINMPFVNGLDFIERFNKICPDACVVIVTGYDDFSYVQKAFKLHVFDYLLKPVNEDDFAALLERMKESLDKRERDKKIINWKMESSTDISSVEDKKAAYSDNIRQALDYINSHFSDEELSLNETADHLHVSPPYLSKIFKEETGDTFQNYLQRLRITKAAEMLKSDENMMKEIAEKCGYSSQHYFSAAFKKETGMSPAEYRKGIADRS